MTPTHDEEVCFCGHDPCEPNPHGPLCRCPCADCTKRRQSVVYRWELTALANRLESKGVSVTALADLVWGEFEPRIEERIADLVGVHIRAILDGAEIRSFVKLRDGS